MKSVNRDENLRHPAEGKIDSQKIRSYFHSLKPRIMRRFMFLLIVVTLGCSRNASDNLSEPGTTTDTTVTAEIQRATDQFSGGYMIGDGVWMINANQEAFEMRNASGQESYMLFFESVEQDTIQVYATKDHSIIIKMYPGYERGMYYEDDEQWSVHRVGPLPPHDETEEEEKQRILRKRSFEDNEAYNSLDSYDGTYTLFTESEGAEGGLELVYTADRIFYFKLNLKALDICTGAAEGQLVMDRTQHGFFESDGCMLHFNFMGNWGDSGMVVEIDQPEKCNLMKGECSFTGKYTTGTPTPLDH